jgi:uncharacterized protein YceK
MRKIFISLFILIILFSTSTGCTRIVEKDGAYTDEEHEYTETTAQATESTPSKIPELICDPQPS